MEPMTALAMMRGLLGGGGGTEVTTSNTSNVSQQLTLAITNAVGGNAGPTSTGQQSAPNTQTPTTSGGSDAPLAPAIPPVIGSAPVSDPNAILADLNAAGIGGETPAVNWEYLGGAVILAVGGYGAYRVWKGR